MGPFPQGDEVFFGGRGRNQLRLAMMGRSEFRPTLGRELAEDGVGELAVDLDMLLTGDRVALVAVSRTGVAQQVAEDVGKEIGEHLLLFERVDPAGSDQFRPSLEIRPATLDMRRKGEAGEMHTHHVRAKERFTFDRHSESPPMATRL